MPMKRDYLALNTGVGEQLSPFHARKSIGLAIQMYLLTRNEVSLL